MAIDEDRSIEGRLENLARRTGALYGVYHLWPGQAKRLQNEGCTLTIKGPGKRKKEYVYKIDYSEPVLGTLSEYLYNCAMESGKAKQTV